MTIRLITTISKIGSIPNPTNATTLRDFYEYMKVNGTSENYQIQNLKAMIVLPTVRTNTNFFDIKNKQHVIAFLDTRIRNTYVDPDI